MDKDFKNGGSVLITGSDGFLGRNLIEALSRMSNLSILKYDIHNTESQLEDYLQRADFVYHIAGVNRPTTEGEFQTGNADLTNFIVDTLIKRGNKPPLVLASSVQAVIDNAYGRSKLFAEKAVERYGNCGGKGLIFRLPNIFGKWSRPNYNSAVATFCHNIARGLEITISDPQRKVDLIYIDDVVNVFKGLLNLPIALGTISLNAGPVKTISLDELTQSIYKMRDIRTDLFLPDMDDPFTKKLYSTYLSFLPDNEFDYSLSKHEDDRGSLAELLKSNSFGQLFISRTKPGVTRGNHYHDTKVEKFCVVEGKAIIRFRHISNDEVISYNVIGTEFRVIDIPPGYTHSIENVGTNELVVLFWSSELFNPQVPDTYFLPVFKSK